MFNRFYLPDLDLETLDVTPRVALSTPEEVRLPMRWTGILHEHLSMSIAASSGVHSGYDVAKLILAGADVAMTTSSLLRNGAAHLATIEEQLTDWMSEHEYDSVDQMRGAVSRAAIADPSAYERANYIGNIARLHQQLPRKHTDRTAQRLSADALGLEAVRGSRSGLRWSADAPVDDLARRRRRRAS